MAGAFGNGWIPKGTNLMSLDFFNQSMLSMIALMPLL